MNTDGRSEDRQNPPVSSCREHVAMIGSRAADFIRASGTTPRTQAGHMTAPAPTFVSHFSLAPQGRPHMTFVLVSVMGGLDTGAR
jgi:hypothetical protein